MPPHHTPTPSGTRAHIRIHGVLHRKHFHHGTDPLLIKQWLLKTEMRYRGSRARRTGRFEDDAAVYLETVKAMPSYSDRAQHIAEWVAVFGSMYRHTISADQIAAQLATWRTASRDVRVSKTKTRRLILSASSVNKRRTALMHLFTVLDGKSAPNPVKDVPKYREPPPVPRGLPYAAIRQLWAKLGDTPTRARLQVMAYIGLPNAQIAALKPEHHSRKAKTVQVQGRRKGAGSKTVVLPLTPDGAEALRAMARTHAWGPFSRSTVRREFRAACRKVRALKALADTLTPYDLRHSFGTEVYRGSGDIRATQALMQHSTPTLTIRYTLGAVDARVRAALRSFGTSESASRSAKTRTRP
jgi:integrase